MKILITGATGLVGASMVKQARDLFKHEVISVSSKDCDLLDARATENYIVGHKPDVVIHLAANVGGLFKNMNNKVEMFEHNIRMNSNVISACHKAGVERFIGTLSTCIFPDKTTYPIDESMLQLGPPHTSNDAYAYAKRMLMVQCDAYNEQHGTNYSCIIPTNVYGDNDNYNLQDAHVIPALIHKCYLAKKESKSFVVAGSGKPLRQFIHADDLANITLQLIDKIDRESVIISPEQEISIGDVAKHIADAFDYSKMMRFNLELPDGQYKKTADNTKMLKLISDYEFIDLKQGIYRTVDHFINNFDQIRK